MYEISKYAGIGMTLDSNTEKILNKSLKITSLLVLVFGTTGIGDGVCAANVDVSLSSENRRYQVPKLKHKHHKTRSPRVFGGILLKTL